MTPLVRAQTEALIGDLYAAGPKRDYKRSLEQHLKSWKSAEAFDLVQATNDAPRRQASVA